MEEVTATAVRQPCDDSGGTKAETRQSSDGKGGAPVTQREEFDVLFLGGGPAGYVGALYAAKLGLRVAVVERDRLGGTCLHRGCIPTKALLQTAALYRAIREAGPRAGVTADGVRFDAAAAHRAKGEAVLKLEQGIRHLFKRARIEVFRGTGRLLGPSIFAPAGAVGVRGEGGEDVVLTPKAVVIATGSRPKALPGLPPDGGRIVTSDEALTLEEVPRSAVIVGGGAIGVEWASLWRDLGAAVTVVEAAETLLPGEDAAIGRELARQFKKRGIRVLTGTTVDVDGTEPLPDGVRVRVRPVHGAGDGNVLEADVVLVAVGRAPNVEDLGLEAAGVRLENGFIATGPHYETTAPSIYAAGDVIGPPMLAHYAQAVARRVIDHLAGRGGGRLDPRLVPRAVYSFPEVAAVGLTEAAARAEGRDVAVGTFPFRGIGKAVIEGEVDGFVKIVADRSTRDVLGVHIIGPRATELIGEGALALLMEAAVDELGEAIRPHPTLSEALLEAALAVDGLAIHA